MVAVVAIQAREPLPSSSWMLNLTNCFPGAEYLDPATHGGTEYRALINRLDLCATETR